MCKPNLGPVDKVLRFALAFWWLGPWAPQFAAPWAKWLVMIVAWIALLESFIGWCGLYALLGMNTSKK